jgi:hypothetical protein
MPELIVTEKIDGTPVAWRCSECRQSFSVRGKLATQERQLRVNAAFKSHLEESHNTDGVANCKAFAAGVPLPDK